MTLKSLDDVLPFVERPSRYLGSEINTIKKDLQRVKLRFALAFPDLYEIGTSHFGLQILYHILNAHSDIAAERVFAPGVDMEEILRKSKRPLFSLESREPLRGFDIIGFSLLYELNYTNILTILDLSQIPFLASERDSSHPMVIAGGPCTCNPEPVADFFDAIVVGDGESAVIEMAAAWMEWNPGDRPDRQDLLERWAQIEGVYIPSFFQFKIDDSGYQSLIPRFDGYKSVRRAIVANLDKTPFPAAAIIPFGKPVHDRLRLEVSRGCSRGCRFCQAGMIYRPVRERSPDHLQELSQRAIAATGYEDISLLSLSTGDYSCIAPLMQRLMTRFAPENIAVSLPSLRAGTLTPELMKLIRKVRKTGFTIAPEAGSQRLRDVINKNISEKEIVDTVTDAFSLGWRVIKLYFMIGLPTETGDDLEAMVNLVKKLRKIKGSGGFLGKINVSVSTFIPKAHTPFQWAAQISLAESRSKLDRLRDQLKIHGIQFKWQNPEVSRLEGLWARGDRRLSRLLITAYKKGCRFDGWSDQFHNHLWQAAIEEENIDPDFFMKGSLDFDLPLPWDHIDSRISKSYLKQEYEKALSCSLTGDCRQDGCTLCGACDFKKIEVITHADFQSDPCTDYKTQSDVAGGFKKLAVYYSKLNQAKYLGHLEMVNIFIRAFRRARIPVLFSRGFHPKPKFSFDDPLPVGIESLQEHFTVTVAGWTRPEELVGGLNIHLPEGIAVISCQLAPQKNARPVKESETYCITLPEGDFDAEKLAVFTQAREVIISLSNQKGKLKKIDLKDMVTDIAITDLTQLQISLKSLPGKTIRPATVMHHVFDLNEKLVRQAKVVKIK